MSRIGRNPVQIPAGVDVTIDGSTLRIKGPKGELERVLDDGITASYEDNAVTVTRHDESKETRSKHGLFRALIAGMVEGVTNGYSKRLEVVGVSYQAAIEGGTRLKLNVGFSHPVYLDIPKGLKVECPSAVLVIVSGCDKQLVGEFAARIRRVRPPEPYKGKGVRYFGEQIIQKAGKSFVGGEK